MEHILITAAEQQELDCAIRTHGCLKEKLQGKIKVDFMLSGIGIAPTCHSLTKEIYRARMAGDPYTLAMNMGLAGSYDLERFPIRSAAVISDEFFGDLGFERSSGFRTLFQCGVWDTDRFPFREASLKRPPLPYSHLEGLLSRYGSAIGVTVQTVSDDMDRITAIKKRFHAEIESMEGAAFHYVLLQEKIPFFALRSVSNAVGESDTGRWDTDGGLKTLEICTGEILHTLLEDTDNQKNI